MENLLTGFTGALLLITVSELGDKTFLIAAILAMRHSRLWVFAGVVAALTLMTILSVLVGQFAALLPQHYVKGIAIALFLGFGFKLLYDARRMGKLCLAAEKEAQLAVEQANGKLPVGKTMAAILTQAFMLTFVAEWGDRTQLATITLAAANNVLGVTTGAVLGHSVCAAIAVVCGRAICHRISERTLTFLGGILFILFAAVGIAEGVY